ncbi:hypothetical protein J2S69_000528 [Glycomyces lechevalierae]|uniref:Uncharacterized protein n=1 Tax=Glycomyces lechevalierae TaxID=256034 RepID=A0ABU2AI02_9ACTN|nr:hypothetical protein [Glycomyces lechevalierae]
MSSTTTWPDVALVALVLIFAGWIAWLWWGRHL